MSIAKGIYEHYKKGKRYAVLGMALDKSTGQELVLYRPLYECEYEYFLRSLAEFTASVTIEDKEISKFTYTGPYDPSA